jgi:hypothetical protein
MTRGEFGCCPATLRVTAAPPRYRPLSSTKTGFEPTERSQRDPICALRWHDAPREPERAGRVSVLDVLRANMAGPSPSGSFGLMIAMGPAFCAELVLLGW